MPSWQVVLDQVEVAFDDERAVASAGLPPATATSPSVSSRAYRSR